MQGRPDQPEFTIERWYGFLFGGPATLGLISANPWGSDGQNSTYKVYSMARHRKLRKETSWGQLVSEIKVRQGQGLEEKCKLR